jgi:saccharopine dehydrogenase-like NADP-dependent oxidoreductase
MDKPNVLIVGAGAVAHVAAHKAAQNNDVLGDICIATRKVEKAQNIIKSIKRKKSQKDKKGKIYAKHVDAMNIPEMVKLIKSTNSSIVINLGTAYINMSVLEACIRAKTVNGRPVTYMDTAIHEDPKKVAEDPPWYANYEWKKKAACKKAGINAILGIGFDPGVVNVWAAYAKKNYFDRIDTIDILDVNAGSHGKYFATNFDPEINFREFKKVWTWINRKWVLRPVHSERWDYTFPVVGTRPVYLNGHDELHSLSKNFPEAKSIRFWMGFGDHYLNVFGVLRNLGMLSEKPVTTAEGVKVVPLKVLKAVLPDPASLAKTYTGWTCIADLVKGWKNGKWREVFIYNNCDHAKCYKEVESQGISYTAGVPPIAAAILVAKGVWQPRTMVNAEELDPNPFIKVLDRIGLKTKVIDKWPKKPTKDGMPISATKSNNVAPSEVW